MKKRIAMLTSLIIMIILATGCGAPTAEETDWEQKQPPIEEKITLAGVGLGDSSNHVKEILGNDYTSEPLHPDGSWFGEPTSRWLFDDQVEVIIGEDSDTVLQINLYGDKYSTSLGDKVGDRADKVLPGYEEKYALAQDHFEGNELPGWFVVAEGEWLIFSFQDADTMVNQPIAGDDQVEAIHLVYERFMH